MRTSKNIPIGKIANGTRCVPYFSLSYQPVGVVRVTFNFCPL